MGKEDWIADDAEAARWVGEARTNHMVGEEGVGPSRPLWVRGF